MAAPVTEQRPASPAAAAPAPLQPAMSPPPPMSASAAAAPTSAAARAGQPAGPGQRMEVPGGQQLTGQRLESVGQRHSFPGGQRLESLAGVLIVTLSPPQTTASQRPSYLSLVCRMLPLMGRSLSCMPGNS